MFIFQPVVTLVVAEKCAAHPPAADCAFSPPLALPPAEI
jgi:hypothetical protein